MLLIHYLLFHGKYDVRFNQAYLYLVESAGNLFHWRVIWLSFMNLIKVVQGDPIALECKADAGQIGQLYFAFTCSTSYLAKLSDFDYHP